MANAHQRDRKSDRRGADRRVEQVAIAFDDRRKSDRRSGRDRRADATNA